MKPADRLLTIYRNAPGDVLARGALWYHVEHRRLRRLARRFGVSTDTACGVVAALSPCTSWTENLARADTLLETGTVGHIPACVKRAQQILAGAAPLDILTAGRKRGKVRAFYLNLARPDVPGPVTIDRWMVAALGLTRDTKYDRCADEVRTAADVVGLMPHEMQSAIWCAVRSNPQIMET